MGNKLCWSYVTLVKFFGLSNLGARCENGEWSIRGAKEALFVGTLWWDLNWQFQGMSRSSVGSDHFPLRFTHQLVKSILLDHLSHPTKPANVRQLPHQMCSKILTHIPLSLASNYVLSVILFPKKDIGDKKSITSHYTYQEKLLNNCLQSWKPASKFLPFAPHTYYFPSCSSCTAHYFKLVVVEAKHSGRC